MFTPNATLHASKGISTRNPRIRHRTGSSEDGELQPKKKQKRSALSAQTFLRPEEQKIQQNGTLQMNGHTQTNGVAKGAQHEAGAPDKGLSLALRGTKKVVERAGKEDGSVTLTKTDNYMVSRLRGLPDQLRANRNERQSFVFDTPNGYVLALTRAHALVWQYADADSSPETNSFALPDASKSSADPLPLGSFVSKTASSSEPGLVVVMPVSGKVIYWESILNATTLDVIRQHRHGVEGTVGSLLSGEVVVGIENAEPAGFILTFSTGRAAQLSLRDSQGRPAVSVHFLRSSTAHSNRGFLSGFTNFFGSGGWRRDVVAVRSGQTRSRGHRDVVIATSTGVMQIWEVAWGGQNSLRAQVDASEDMLAAMKGANTISTYNDEPSFEVLDFAFVPGNRNSTTVSTTGDADDLRLLVLAFSAAMACAKYYLIELSITADTARVEMVHPIRCYSDSLGPKSAYKPVLILPEPAHSAFVIFNGVVVIASIAKREESPDSQLLMDAHKLPEPFEDVIVLNDTIGPAIIGSSFENRQNLRPSKQRTGNGHMQSACIVAIQGEGVLRLTAFESKQDLDAIERARITPKTKIEQAVFFGHVPGNILNFSSKPAVAFAQTDVESAALEISEQILKSTSPFVQAITPSLEQQLKQRSDALKDLALHLKQNYPPLSRITKWKLMWHAEKMAAARAIWKTYNARLIEKNPEHRDSLLSDLVGMLHEEFKTEPVADLGEKDPVRQWFIKDIWRLEHIVPWAYNAVAELSNDGTRDQATLARLVSEADDLSLGALETAFAFRQENASLYGLGEEALVDGVLERGYEGLPEFWTSTYLIVTTTKMLVDLAMKMASDNWDKPPAEGHPDPMLVKKIGEENVRQIQICCLSYTESYRWCSDQSNEKTRLGGKHIKMSLLTFRPVQITKLAEIGLVDEGILLAEKYQDMAALVDLVVEELHNLSLQEMEPAISDEEAVYLRDRIEAVQDRVSGYFDSFGNEWSEALYSHHIAEGHLASLLEDNTEYQTYLTKFLRKDPRWRKISWINDICGEDDYSQAGHTLTDLAHDETGLWNKKVEMSLGKLAWLAVCDGTEVDKKTKDYVQYVDKQVGLLDIQEQLHDHISPDLQAALDEEAALELAMENCGTTVTDGKSALRHLLEKAMAKLITRKALDAEALIDILTLLDRRPDREDEGGVTSLRFLLALQVLKLSGMEENKERKELTEKIIWRRCMISDNWESMNNTHFQGDVEMEDKAGMTLLFQTLKEGYRTGFWEGPSALHPLSPQEIIGAGCTIQDLRRRFRQDTEGLLEDLKADMEDEDQQLQTLIDQGRLDLWFSGVNEAAKKSVRDDADAAGKAAKEKKELEDGVEAGFRKAIGAA
ncbi:MAG: hypothetical protein M1812_007775 [Candelaria pacifica]|nr:MAG: hypothetical protein M1812_007775 [Candelaria pacifica]